MGKIVSLFLEIFELVRVKWVPIAARYNVDLRARITSKSEDFIARILDISESGCFACVDHNIEVGSLVGIDFQYRSTNVHSVAIVVRNTKTPEGCGFMFVAATSVERQGLRNLIRKLEQDSAKSTKKQAA